MTDTYYSTPNLMIPLNDRPPGEIAPVALEELERWQVFCALWETYTDGRANRCAECHQNIWFSKDPQGHEYQYTIDEILALKVAHVRQCHDTGIQAANGDSVSSSNTDANRRK